MKTVVFTLQEIWQETKTKVFKNKKKYSRKNKEEKKWKSLKD